MISLTSPVKTWAHGWSAGLKLAALCVTTVVLFAAQGVIWHFGFFLFTGLLYALPGKVFWRAGAARLWALWPFVVLMLVWHVLTGQAQGGTVIVLRMMTAVALANLVTMTTRLSDMMGVMRWLMRPLRLVGVKTERIELAMALVIRFTPVLSQKGSALVMAWRARSAHRAGWRIMIPFAVLAIDDAEQVAEALRARGGL